MTFLLICYFHQLKLNFHHHYLKQVLLNHLLIEYKGEKHILKDWCKILNKNYHTMYDRIHRLNMSFENALNYIDPRDKLLLWEGKYYTKKELSEKYNIPLSNFYDRRRKGWSLEKILLTPVIHKI